MRTTIITSLVLCAVEFLTIVLASPMARPSLVSRFFAGGYPGGGEISSGSTEMEADDRTYPAWDVPAYIYRRHSFFGIRRAEAWIRLLEADTAFHHHTVHRQAVRYCRTGSVACYDFGILSAHFPGDKGLRRVA